MRPKTYTNFVFGSTKRTKTARCNECGNIYRTSKSEQQIASVCNNCLTLAPSTRYEYPVVDKNNRVTLEIECTICGAIVRVDGKYGEIPEVCSTCQNASLIASPESLFDDPSTDDDNDNEDFDDKMHEWAEEMINQTDQMDES